MEAAPGKKILIIEDERDVVDLLTFNLRKAGFTASTATDGGAGLQRARSEKPAFIILDLMLPKMPVSRAAQPRNDHQFLTWDIQVEVLQIVLARTTDLDDFSRHLEEKRRTFYLNTMVWFLQRICCGCLTFTAAAAAERFHNAA